VKSSEITAAAGWASLGVGGIIGAILGLGVYGLAKKDKSMTALEKAFNGLVVLLCQRAAEDDQTIDKLRKELSERPTREQLNASEKSALHLQDEVSMLKRKTQDLTEQLELALKGGRKPEAKRRGPTRPA
jgi:hypothetical protein